MRYVFEWFDLVQERDIGDEVGFIPPSDQCTEPHQVFVQCPRSLPAGEEPAPDIPGGHTPNDCILAQHLHDRVAGVEVPGVGGLFYRELLVFKVFLH